MVKSKLSFLALATLSIACIPLSFSNNAQAAQITVTAQPNVVEIVDYSIVPPFTGDSVTVLGTSYSAATHGSNSVSSSAVHTLGASSTVITLDTSFFLGTQSSGAHVYYQLFFTVGAEDLTYSLAGGYSSDAGQNFASVRMYDEISGGGPIVASSQSTISTFIYGPADYPLGGSNGFTNSNIGSPTGTLFAGRDYSFTVWNEIRSIQGDTGTASGEYTLTLTAVPEPSSALLLIGAGSVLALVRRRRA